MWHLQKLHFPTSNNATFSRVPQWHCIKGQTVMMLLTATGHQTAHSTHWSFSTFQASFTWLLCVSVRLQTLFLLLRTWGCIHILGWATLWTEFSFSACPDLPTFGNQETYPRQRSNNCSTALASIKRKAREDSKSPNNTCKDTPWGSANSSQEPHTTTLQMIV